MMRPTRQEAELKRTLERAKKMHCAVVTGGNPVTKESCSAKVHHQIWRFQTQNRKYLVLQNGSIEKLIGFELGAPPHVQI